MSSSKETAFRKVKSIVFNKDDEEFFNKLSKAGYFDKTFNERVKKLIKADFEKNAGSTSAFTKEQEEAILAIIKSNFKNISVDKDEDIKKEEEEVKPSKAAIAALGNLMDIRNNKKN